MFLSLDLDMAFSKLSISFVYINSVSAFQFLINWFLLWIPSYILPS